MAPYARVFPLELKPVVLDEGMRVRLEPLEERHVEELLPLIDPEIWRWYTVDIDGPEALRRFLRSILADQVKRSSLGFAVREKASGRLVGSSRFLNVDAANRRLEIGSTWYAPRWQRTYVNTVCKLLMLAHAFDALECIAVQFQADVLNERSRAAIERLGARLDGVIRSHRICDDGRIRDSAIYSITAAEWPAARERLAEKLAR